MSTGKSTQAEIGATFLNALWETKENKIKRKDFMAKHWQDIKGEDLDKLIIDLEQAELISMQPEGNEVWYQMTQKCKEIFEKK